MKAEDVAVDLPENPEFFEQYSELLLQISIPNPHGGHAIPLSDRQVLTLREKTKVLETKLSELIRFGEENDAIGEKMHRLPPPPPPSPQRGARAPRPPRHHHTAHAPRRGRARGGAAGAKRRPAAGSPRRVPAQSRARPASFPAHRQQLLPRHR